MLKNAKLIKGVWFPKWDKHLTDMIEHHSKIGDVTLKDGRVVGTYQKHKLDFAMRQAVPSDRRRTAVDIGAHIGLWSMHLAELFKSVHAFEPLKFHRELFGENVKADNVILHPYALGDSFSSATIAIDHLNTGNAHIMKSEEDIEKHEQLALSERRRLGIDTDAPIETELVEIIPLDQFDLQNVDFIKIDVEGFELQVVQGARETILKWKPSIIVEQKGNDAKFWGAQRNVAGQYLQDLGMTLRQDYGGDWIMKW